MAFTIGYIQNNTGPQEYEYKNYIVVVDKKYQCPKHCAVNHNHHVHYDKNITKNHKMHINKSDLGSKIKKNNKKK